MTWGSLDNDIPEEIIVGNGTVIYIYGWAYSPGRTISGVCFSVNGYQQKMNKIRIPRIDLLPHVMQLKGIGKPDHNNAVRSGFAGYLSFGKDFPREQQTARLTVEFTDGGSAIDLPPRIGSKTMLRSRVDFTKEEGHVQEEIPSRRDRSQAALSRRPDQSR